MRNYDGLQVTSNDIENVLNWQETHTQQSIHVPFFPARVILQDFRYATDKKKTNRLLNHY